MFGTRILTKFFYLSHRGMEPAKLTREVMNSQRKLLEDLIKRRFVYGQAFEIHGGCGGLFDYGPIGCAIATNLEQLWRDFFVLEEDMLEIRGPCVTPIQVLKASGHVGKFTDLMVRDVKTNQGIRADKLLIEFLNNKLNNQKEKLSEEERKELEHILINADGYKQQEMTNIFEKLKIKSMDTGNELTKPEPFSLMFQTNIGPNGDLVGFLRPETAQGIFVDFGKLLQYNGGRMPFAAAQVGLGFRNEIAPRNGLIRVREFMMAEIEHFVDPEDKSHPKFKEYRELQLPLFSQPDQQSGKDYSWMKIGKAVDDKVVHNQTLGYFLARIHLFLTAAGVDKHNLRFRQLSKDERAHYAQDCWDCQINTSLGWVECVGTADRSAYDLEHHSAATGQKLLAARKFKEAKPKQQITIVLNKGDMAKTYKKDVQILLKHIENLDETEKAALKKEFEEKGEKELLLENVKFNLTKENTTITQKTINVMEQKYVPHVIEPSFGLGRIIYSILEHCFKIRDEKRTFFALPPKIAPVKVSILPLQNDQRFGPVIKDLKNNLKRSLISSKVDDTGQAIGKRYARTDEIGIPFGITVDFDTLKDQTVTLRELLTMKQVRIPISEVVKVIFDLSEEFVAWNDVLAKYPAFESKEQVTKE